MTSSPPARCVAAFYSGFASGELDTISVVDLDEHLDRLSGRDLRQLETRVPLDTLKMVVDLAVEIGREGREGQPLGTILVVGDTRKVMACSPPGGLRSGHGLLPQGTEPQRSVGARGDQRNRPDGWRDHRLGRRHRRGHLPLPGCSAANVTLSKGLGTRHWAAAAISRPTNAVAITVSQSNGTVRIFQNGEVVLRIEPFHRRPMVWRNFDFDAPNPEAKLAKPKA